MTVCHDDNTRDDNTRDDNMILLLFLFGLALGAETEQQGESISLSIGGSNVAVHQGTCPQFWFNYNSRCYKYVSTHMTWADAEINCRSQGGNLVSIHRQDEDDFVRAMIKNFDPAAGRTWIGLSDTYKEGSMMWSDGCAVKFGFWESGEPNNENGNEDCVHNNHDTVGRWNDRPCSDTYPSVCATRILCA